MKKYKLKTHSIINGISDKSPPLMLILETNSIN